MKNTALEKDLLYSDLEFQINRIKRKKTSYVWAYRLIKIVVFAASATITVLVGWNGGENGFGNKNTVLVVSGIVSVLIAVEGLMAMKDKALRYDLLLYELRALRNEMCYSFDNDYDGFVANRNSYFERFQVIQAAQKSIIETAFD